ncbi:MAG: hypothetical protein EYC70_01600 [Planctomycetota bacterium]|nr:MAG: hypothetical protein EYC70_01600 [Planctomycetota bacterium]
MHSPLFRRLALSLTMCAASAASALPVAALGPAPGQSPGGAGGRQKDDTRSNGHSAQARGDGDFVVHVNDLLPPPGARLSGIVDPHLSNAALPIFDRIAPDGAVIRGHVFMQSSSIQPDYIGGIIEQAHDLGFRIMVTFHGTPQSMSTQPGDSLYYNYPPVNPEAWAALLVTVLQSIYAASGHLPDYVKIWNEPERPETWLGGREEFLVLYAAASQALEDAITTGALPAGMMKIGGPGMAGADSTMSIEEGARPLLYDIMDDAVALGYPLDYICWHSYDVHYLIGNALRYYPQVQQMRDYAASVGLPDVEVLIDEWNLKPSAIGLEKPMELDTQRCAGNALIFLAAAAQTDVDGLLFFQLQDVDGQNQIQDLTGAGTGLFSRRGMRKPVMRIFELMCGQNGMFSETGVQVEYPVNEWSAGMYASRVGNRVRVALSNDPVYHRWIWVAASEERGVRPGVLENAYDALNALGLAFSIANLTDEGGLTLEEAYMFLEVYPLADEALFLEDKPREIRIQVAGAAPELVRLAWPAYRFDDTHNNPALRRTEFLGLLQMDEEMSRRSAYDTVVPLVLAEGGSPPPFDPARLWTNDQVFAQDFGLSDPNDARTIFGVYRETVEASRLAYNELLGLNFQPASILMPDVPENVGLACSDGVISVTLQPGDAIVFDLTF